MTRATLICLMALMVGVSCQNEPTAPGETTASLQIDATSFVIFSGASMQLQAIATLNDGTQKDVTADAVWSVTPGIYGQVNQGKFVAHFNVSGVENIKAEFAGHVASRAIEILPKVVAISVLPVASAIQAGEQTKFTAIALLDNTSQEIVTAKMQWTVTPPAAGQVDDNGVFQSRVGVLGPVQIRGEFSVDIPGADYRADSSEIELVASFRETTAGRFDMVEIPEGSFIMGDDNGEADERPAHQIFLNSFLISRYEITHAQYVKFLNQALQRGQVVVEMEVVVGRAGRFFNRPYLVLREGPNPNAHTAIVFLDGRFLVVPGLENHPVVKLTWYGATAFCDFYGLRLPTEAEWEKACRGGQQLDFGTADGSLSHDLANYAGEGGADVFERSAPVGSFPPNPFGLFDMAGNASEFVFDTYDAAFYSSSPMQNPIGPGPAEPVGQVSGLSIRRGGSWIDDPHQCRSAARTEVERFPEIGGDEDVIGFRVAKSLP